MSKTSDLAFKHGFTLGHLHQTGGRELEHILERYDAAVEQLAKTAEKIVTRQNLCDCPHCGKPLDYDPRETLDIPAFLRRGND